MWAALRFGADTLLVFLGIGERVTVGVIWHHRSYRMCDKMQGALEVCAAMDIGLALRSQARSPSTRSHISALIFGASPLSLPISLGSACGAHPRSARTRRLASSSSAPRFPRNHETVSRRTCRLWSFVRRSCRLGCVRCARQTARSTSGSPKPRWIRSHWGHTGIVACGGMAHGLRFVTAGTWLGAGAGAWGEASRGGPVEGILRRRRLRGRRRATPGLHGAAHPCVAHVVAVAVAPRSRRHSRRGAGLGARAAGRELRAGSGGRLGDVRGLALPLA